METKAFLVFKFLISSKQLLNVVAKPKVSEFGGLPDQIQALIRDSVHQHKGNLPSPRVH